MVEARLCGAKVQITFGFVALIALLCICNGDAMIGIFLCACLVHELGHLIPLLAFGQRIAGVRLSAVGIRMRMQYSGIMPTGREALILLSGPMSNLLAGTILLLCGLQTAAAMHLTLFVWNLLPYRGLDGGALLELLISDRLAICRPHWIPRILRGSALFASALIVTAAVACGVRNPAVYAVVIVLSVSEIL